MRLRYRPRLLRPMVTREMSFAEPSEQLELVAAARRRIGSGMTSRERWTRLITAAAFVVAATSLAASAGWPRPDPVAVVVAVTAIALASSVELEIGSGFGTPTEILLVPMLLALPAGEVPLVVGAGVLAAQLPRHLRGGMPWERAFVALGNASYSIAPAVVVVTLEPSRASASRTAGVLALAVVAQLAVDFALSILRERWALGLYPRQLLQPLALVWFVDASLAALGIGIALGGERWRPGYLLPLPFLALAFAFSRERRVRLTQAMELSSAYKGTAVLLGDVVEADDAYTGAHSRDVLDLVGAVSAALELDARERQLAEFTALLHDVGKLRIPNEIVSKPGPLTPEERALIETHTIEGQRLLEPVGGLLAEVGKIVRSCHERVDGMGYPDGLAGDEIPLVARIVSCCDAFSAMTTRRPYRDAMTVDAAVAELRRCSGSQFDPQVVDILVGILGGATVREAARGAAPHMEPLYTERPKSELSIT